MKFFVPLMLVVFASPSIAGNTDFSSGNYMLPHCRHFITDNYNFDVWDGDCGGIISTLLNAPSMGKFYNANIKGGGSDGPYDCRTHRVPAYQ